MKKIVLMLLLASGYCSAQVVVGDVNINEIPEVQFCQVLAATKFLTNKVVITIDYGQEIKWGSGSSQVLDPATGKRRTFNSVIDAINYMEANGWEYVDSIVVTIETQNVYHYHFRRKPKRS